MHFFTQIPYQSWGPWKNHWGYTTTVAQFDDESIMVKSYTPYNTKIVCYFSNWENCQEFIELIEQDRRF